MKKIAKLAVVWVVLLGLLTPAWADQASSLYNKGKDAEARQDYEAAYNFYEQARQLKPKNVDYRTAVMRVRFEASAMHVHQGQKFRDAGKLEEALAEFQKAAVIDPSNFFAQQEIRRTRTMIESAKSSAAGEGRPEPMAFQRKLEASAGSIELQPLSNAPITLKLTEDTKVIYETVGKLAGINVLFDPDYTSRRVHIELNGVTLGEALGLIAMESRTFWRPVTSNTIFVAADTPAKRKELEQNVLKTFYLANLSQPTELQDVVNTLRTVLEVNRLTQVPSQGAIVVRGTPDQIALAEKLIDDLDKAKSEVIVDVAIMVVNRNHTFNYGLTPPTQATVQLAPNLTNLNGTNTNGTNANGTTTPGTTPGTGGSANPFITLNQFSRLTANDFLVSIGPAQLNLLWSDSDTKLIQNPQIRALDGQKATLKIGQRLPVATGSFGAGIGSVGIQNALVNTQFQYLDVGVNVEITPKIHAGREVTLKLSVDVSSHDSDTNIGGINQPVIGQRKIEHEVRLRDGEANLLGGILDEQDIKSLSGIPGLASIPVFKYLFSGTSTNKIRNELVFVLTPHIVRAQELSPLNTRPLDVGTSNTLELRQFDIAPSKPAAPGAAATPAPAPGFRPGPTAPAAAAPAPVANPAANPGAAATAPNGSVPPPRSPGAPGGPVPVQGASQGTLLSFNPGDINTTVGQTFNVDLVVSGAQNLFSVPVQIQYDPTKLELANVSNAGFLGQGEQPVALVQRDDPASGLVQINANRPPNSGGASGQGSVFTLTFRAKDAGQANLSVGRAGLRDASNQSIPASGTPATVNIKALPAAAQTPAAPPPQ